MSAFFQFRVSASFSFAKSWTTWGFPVYANGFSTTTYGQTGYMTAFYSGGVRFAFGQRHIGRTLIETNADRFQFAFQNFAMLLQSLLTGIQDD